MHQPQINSHYLAAAFDKSKLKKFIKQAVALANNYDFDAFAFRGVSGALVAPILGYLTDKTLIAVRKPKDYSDIDPDHCHSFLTVEGDYAVQRYIIVDDCISTGRTVQQIITQISEKIPTAKCLGIILYTDFLSYGGSCELLKLHDQVNLDGLDDLYHRYPEKFRIK